MAPLAVSCFGKLPFHREFLRLGLGTPASAWVVRWVEGAHAAWTARGDAPAESSLARFAVTTDGGGLLAGVVRQSSDGLRRHPVTFFVEDVGGVRAEDWPLVPVALAATWATLAALAARQWDDLASLTSALEAARSPLDWAAAQAAHGDTLAAPLAGAVWESVTDAAGDAGRHAAANLLAVAEAQRQARSAAEGISVALPLPTDPSQSAARAGFWLALLAAAVGAGGQRPAMVLGEAPPRLVAFYRPPEGPDLAAVLSSLDMAPIDDVTEPWRSLPEPGSERANAVEAIVAPSGARTRAELLTRVESVARA